MSDNSDSIDISLQSDDIRRRERRRRRQGPLWGFLSVAAHVAFFAVIIFCTPVRDLVFEEKEMPPPNPAEDLSADRLEDLSDRLEEAHRNELLEELEEMQAVLHNMEMMKQELLEDYDDFAEENSRTMKDELEKLLDEAEKAQRKAVEEQPKVEQKVEELVREEQQNLDDENRQKKLRELAADVMLESGAKVVDEMAKAVNALDRLQIQAEFTGLAKAAKAAEKAMDAQKEVAARQDVAQRETNETAAKLAKALDHSREKEQNEKWKREQEQRRDKAKADAEQAHQRMEQARADQKKADAERQDAEKRRETANAEGEKAKNEEKSLREQASKTEDKNKANELRQKADAASRLAREKRDESHRANEEARRRQNEYNSAVHREKNEERCEERARKNEEDAKANIAKAEERIREKENALREIEKTRREKGTHAQVENLQKVRKDQEELVKKLAAVREALANDTPSLEKLASEEFRDSEMVRRNLSSMKLVAAYELAKEMEAKITENYKDIKATETAISRRMSYKAAQKLTDVARTERMELDEKTREALEARVRTKSALDAQKVAEADVMREADNIVESSKAMMEDAMKIVKPDFAAKSSSGSRSSRGEKVEWLTEENFKDRDSAEARAERLAAMSADADYQLALSEAAAEDESQRVKNVAAVQRNPPSSSEGEGEAAAQGIPGSQKADDSGGRRAKQGSGQKDALFGGGGPGPLQGSMPDLIAGNVVRFGRLPTGVQENFGGIPAKWMYVNSWYVIGPFPNPNRVNLRRKFPPESVIDLDATYPGKDGKMVGWRFMQAQSSVREWWGAPFKARVKLNGDHQYEIWYAYAEVFSDTEGDVWFAVGSDDRSDVWLNGQPVWGSSNKLKPWQISEGFRLVHLKRGRNRILMRVENGWGPLEWSLCIGVGEGNPSK